MRQRYFHPVPQADQEDDVGTPEEDLQVISQRMLEQKREAQHLRERIFRLEEQCDLPGLVTNNRRARVAWLIVAAMACGLITAALPLVNAWAWLQLGPMLDATDGKWTVHSSMQLTTVVLMAFFGVLSYVASVRAVWLLSGSEPKAKP